MSGSAGRSCWFVVHCKPREDARALEHLQRQSFHCYAPTLKVDKVRQNRRIAVQEPMFPRYVFVQLDEVNNNWHRIRSTRGVAQLVHCHERLLPVDDRIIEGIRARLAVDQPCVPYLKAGELVVITDGPFSDVEAIFLANDGKERVILLMNILHREQTLPFPVGSVRKARDPMMAS
jgi:transcriptional antiterminator RfaH